MTHLQIGAADELFAREAWVVAAPTAARIDRRFLVGGFQRRVRSGNKAARLRVLRLQNVPRGDGTAQRAIRARDDLIGE